MSALDLSGENVLLVVEGSAACPAWPAHLGQAPEQGWCMLEQEEWEPFEAFHARLSDTLDRVVLPSEGSAVVALVVSRFWEARELSARRKLAVEILSRLAQSGGGRLVLTHGHQHDAPSRDALAQLAEELSPEWADSTITVTVRAEDRPRREIRKPSSPVLRVVGQPTAT